VAQIIEKSKAYIFQLVCAGLGFLTSLYLLIQHTRLKSGIQDGAGICSITSWADCDAVNASAYSEVFGLSLAAVGAIFFSAFLVMGLFAPPNNKNFACMQRVMAWLALAGFGVDLFLLGAQVFDLQTICLFCFATYVLNIAHLYLNGLMVAPTKRGFAPIKNALRGVPNCRLTIDWPSLILAKIAMIGLIAAILLLPSGIWLRSHFYSFVNNAVERFYQNWKDKPGQTIKISEKDGQAGNPKANITIVEFSDFECPHCQKMAFTFHALLPSIKNKVHFVFKNFPLDSSCNPTMKYRMHPNACKLAQLSYCANQKGKFWAFHDAIYFGASKKKKPDWEDYKKSIKRILNEEEITTCLQSSEGRAKLDEDIRLGNRLGIQGTPAIYINGKEVTIPITVETLKRIIEIESGSGK